MDTKNEKYVLRGKIALLEDLEAKRGLSDSEDHELRVAKEKLGRLSQVLPQSAPWLGSAV